jgi:hypothetical protein
MYMPKTQNKKNRKRIRKTKKTHGGEPSVMKIEGYYDDADKKLVAYYILHSKMNDEQKQQYAEKHKVFFPSKSLLGNLLDINPKSLKKNIDNYFYPSNEKVKNKKYSVKSKTIVVHDADDIQKIKMANKIIGNIKLNDANFTDEMKTQYNGKNINVVVNEYVNFITTNKDLLLQDFVDTATTTEFLKEDGERMLRSPVFLKKIGEKYKIFDNWSQMLKKEGGLDKIYQKLI